MTLQFSPGIEEKLRLWREAVGEEAVLGALTKTIYTGYWTAVCQKRIILPKPPSRPVGRPKMSEPERDGRRAARFVEQKIWPFWRDKLGERFELTAGPLYRQWQQRVNEGDWEWLARFKTAQPWQQLQGPMAGKEWAE